MADVYSNKVADITEKVSDLISAYHILKEENSHLLTENKQIKERLEKQADAITGLSKQKSLEQLGEEIAISGNFDKAEVKQKINEFIKEIDKCVAMLNS